MQGIAYGDVVSLLQYGITIKAKVVAGHHRSPVDQYNAEMIKLAAKFPDLFAVVEERVKER